MREHAQHVGVLVAQQEFDRAVLQRLEPRRRPEDFAEFHVFRRRERLQHRPHFRQLPRHLLAAREDLLARVEAILAQVRGGRRQLVDEQLHPQFRDLVLDDEEEFVVVRRARQRLLRAKQALQLQVAP